MKKKDDSSRPTPEGPGRYDNDEGGSVFVASLGEVKLPPAIENRVAGEIQAAVMRGLAAVDFGGEVNTQFPRDLFPWGRTLGMWVGRPPTFPDRS
jgi:hypothetical protein